MPDDKYLKRLESLFSRTESTPPESIPPQASPEPEPVKPPVHDVEVVALRAKVADLEARLQTQAGAAMEGKTAMTVASQGPASPASPARLFGLGQGSPFPTQLDPPTETNRARNAFRVAMAFLVGTLAVHAASTVLAFQTQASQLFILAGTALALEVAELAGLYAIRRGRPELGIQLIFGVWLLILPVASLLVAGLGLLLAAAAVVIMSAVARQTLSGKQTVRMVVASIVTGIATLLLDVIGPAGRVAVPELTTTIMVAAGALLLVYAYFLVRQYPTLSLRVKSTINLAVLVLAVIAVGVAGTLGLNNLNFQVDNLYNFMLIPIDEIYQANLALSQVQESYLEIASGELSRQDIEVTASQIQALDDKFQATLNRYDTEWLTALSDPFTELLARNGWLSLQKDEVAALSRVHSNFGLYLTLREVNMPRILDGSIDPVKIERLRQTSGFVQAEMERLIAVNLQFAEVSYQDAAGSYQSSTAAMAVTGVLVTLLGVGLVFALLRSIVVPLNALRDTAGKVASGQLDVVVRVFAHNEIGLVSGAFNTMVARMRELVGSLETRVAARTRDLELAADVGRNLAQERDLDILLANAVELIRARFDLYYTQIYLTDPNRRSLALRAGTGSAGLELLRRSHRLSVGPGSINGRAASERRAVIVADTAASGTFKPNPLLPDTRSEMAVPLIVGEQVVGVLDLQSDKPGALIEENLPAFEALAGQLAIAVQNADLFAQAKQAQTDVELQVRGLARSGWKEFLNAIDRGERQSFTYNQHSLEPLNEPLLPASNGHTLAVPITFVGEPVGAIHLERDVDAEHAWTLDDTELVNLVAARVARQVDNLRLLAQAEQYRAEAEAATRRLTREGWEGYLGAAPIPGYIYDLNEVTPLHAAPNGDGSPLASQTLKVQDEVIGELTVDGVESLDEEAVELLAKVAERLSAHIENLRLTEQTQVALAEQAATVSRLRELDQLKSSFLANMSHELRTPLNSILGFTDVMLEGLDGPVTDQMDNDLHLISRNGQHLLSLINDVLDMAKIEAGKMNLSIEAFDLREVLHEVTDIVSPLTRDKSLDLQIQTDAADDLRLEADRVRLRQIMINVVNNAVKFTETGGVSIGAKKADDWIKISIKDTGVGIPPDQADMIFEEFRQADTSTTRKAGGTGLGLPITKRLVELHGGRLWVESTGVRGEGSTFHIELPVHSTHSSQPAAQSTPAAVAA